MSERVKRIPLHTRRIEVQGFLREDGLWEVEGSLSDIKADSIELADRGLLPVGKPLHQMNLLLTVDKSLTIVEAIAEMNATPYQDCSRASEQYDKLVGIRIGPGWMDQVKNAIGRPTGCTHLTEMLPVLATGLMQTITGYRVHIENNDINTEQDKRMLLNSCFGFREGGRAEKIHWIDGKAE